MSVESRILKPKFVLAFALGAAVPLTAYAANEPEPMQKAAPIEGQFGKKPFKPKRPLECTKEETGRSICRDNGYGDQVCEPEIIEHCPLPL